MSENSEDPVELEEPDGPGARLDEDYNIWTRGLFMILFALFFALAETVLGVIALVQFFWMLFAKERNRLLADFGRDLGRWLQDVARFQSGVSDDKPFPWRRWG